MVLEVGRENETEEEGGRKDMKIREGERKGYGDTKRKITEEEEGKRTLRQVMRIITSNGKRRL